MSRQLSAFKKWNNMIERHQAETEPGRTRSGPCRVTIKFICPIDEWQDLIAGLKNKDLSQQLDRVNRHMNRAPYITDIINWGVKDYWATMRQFFTKDGDCEDYAIAKYYSLKELGVPAENMRIVVVQDTNLEVAHAVLVVYDKEKTWVLDNQIQYVVQEKTILHYKPLYSINEQAWWLHRM
ncbi:transglutaminase-like cysteine peptidase [Emcibacter sp.]|uniref:transglutaminase-like cysteine peptidase n=1 Tax=Emcibacter sp. TaxID=1979954 RepID=UPI003A8CEAD9